MSLHPQSHCILGGLVEPIRQERPVSAMIAGDDVLVRPQETVPAVGTEHTDQVQVQKDQQSSQQEQLVRPMEPTPLCQEQQPQLQPKQPQELDTPQLQQLPQRSQLVSHTLTVDWERAVREHPEFVWVMMPNGAPNGSTLLLKYDCASNVSLMSAAYARQIGADVKRGARWCISGAFGEGSTDRYAELQLRLTPDAPLRTFRILVGEEDWTASQAPDGFILLEVGAIRGYTLHGTHPFTFTWTGVAEVEDDGVEIRGDETELLHPATFAVIATAPVVFQTLRENVEDGSTAPVCYQDATDSRQDCTASQQDDITDVSCEQRSVHVMSEVTHGIDRPKLEPFVRARCEEPVVYAPGSTTSSTLSSPTPSIPLQSQQLPEDAIAGVQLADNLSPQQKDAIRDTLLRYHQAFGFANRYPARLPRMRVRLKQDYCEVQHMPRIYPALK